MMLAKPGRPALVLVPKSERADLMERVHEELQHAGHRRMLQALRMTYIWEGMSADVLRFVRDCILCSLSKFKLNMAHGQYRAVEYSGPGDAVGLDFYSVAMSEDGFCVIMLMIDLFSRWRRYVVLRSRRAVEVVEGILNEWVYVRGCPPVWVSDSDPALMGAVAQGLMKALSVTHIHTQHYPQGNAVTERGFVLLGECMRRMPKSKRSRWTKELPRIEFAANITSNADLGDLSPYQVEHGRLPRLPFDAQFVEDFDLDAAEHKRVGLYGQATTALYRDVAASVSAAARTMSNDRLNERGASTKTVQYKVGDRVVIYLPPRGDKKSAHVLCDRSLSVARHCGRRSINCKHVDHAKCSRAFHGHHTACVS